MTPENPPLLPTLPLHLMLTMGCWLSSPFALRCAKSAFPLLNSGPLLNQIEKLLPENAPQQLQQLEKALSDEARNRANNLLSGILSYIETPYSRKVTEPPVLWQRGNARLLDYGAATATYAGQPIVLFIPSLINRYYILDLEEERSMLRYMGQQGVYALALDWGTPGDFEESFGCGEYVTEILGPAIDFISQIAKQRIVLAGYCMGGVMALAAAKLWRKKLAGLALFATPWDFYCDEFEPFIMDKKWRPTIESAIAGKKHLPADVIQSLFYLTDPFVFEQKFRRFANLQPDSRAAKDFVALEHWVNDGVPMTAQVARDCLLDWAQDNVLARNRWKVGGEVIDPRRMRLPSFIAIPRNDHVVPQGCALPLAKALSHAHVIEPGAGHVSMMVGGSARRELWQPFADWVKNTP